MKYPLQHRRRIRTLRYLQATMAAMDIVESEGVYAAFL